jgi:hypothetical protein
MKPGSERFIFEIRVQGHLDPFWYAWFEGWEITNLENGEALLKSATIDPAGVHGALSKIRDLNLGLVSVVRIPAEGDNFGRES